MSIAGVLSVRNGEGLGYPFTAVIKSLAALCDVVYVGLDPEFPKDFDSVRGLSLPNVALVDAPWDMTNRAAGSEIAIQMDALVERARQAGARWAVVMQADEVLHEDDSLMLRRFMDRYKDDSSVSGFSMERTYFWKDLETVREDWAADLVRIYKPGTYSFMAEGTDKAGMYAGPVAEGSSLKLPYKIYHYSRVDSPGVISSRVRNLDTFFHAEETLVEEALLPEYDFIPREYDNYSKGGMPAVVEGKFSKFKVAAHPRVILDWYGV